MYLSAAIYVKWAISFHIKNQWLYYSMKCKQEGYIEELTRFSQCLNAKTGFVNFWSVYQSFLYWIFMFQIVHFQKILEGQCLNSIRLTAPLYILLVKLGVTIKDHNILKSDLWLTLHPRRIYRGAVNLILFRHCPSKIFCKCSIWNVNIQYKNDWYTLQKLTKPVFAFRHCENLVSSSIYPSCIAPHSMHCTWTIFTNISVLLLPRKKFLRFSNEAQFFHTKSWYQFKWWIF